MATTTTNLPSVLSALQNRPKFPITVSPPSISTSSLSAGHTPTAGDESTLSSSPFIVPSGTETGNIISRATIPEGYQQNRFGGVSKNYFANLPQSFSGGQYTVDPLDTENLLKSERQFLNDPSIVKYLRAGGSSRFSQLDHIVHLWAGGADTPENLQRLNISDHDNKTKIQAVVMSMYYGGKLSLNAARNAAINWRDKVPYESKIILDQDGNMPLSEAQKIWNIWQKPKEVTWKDVKDVMAEGREGASYAFIRGIGSGGSLGWLENQKRELTPGESVASIAGEVTGIIGAYTTLGGLFGGFIGAGLGAIAGVVRGAFGVARALKTTKTIKSAASVAKTAIQATKAAETAIGAAKVAEKTKSFSNLFRIGKSMAPAEGTISFLPKAKVGNITQALTHLEKLSKNKSLTTGVKTAWSKVANLVGKGKTPFPGIISQGSGRNIINDALKTAGFFSVVGQLSRQESNTIETRAKRLLFDATVGGTFGFMGPSGGGIKGFGKIWGSIFTLGMTSSFFAGVDAEDAFKDSVVAATTFAALHQLGRIGYNQQQATTILDNAAIKDSFKLVRGFTKYEPTEAQLNFGLPKDIQPTVLERVRQGLTKDVSLKNIKDVFARSTEMPIKKPEIITEPIGRPLDSKTAEMLVKEAGIKINKLQNDGTLTKQEAADSWKAVKTAVHHLSSENISRAKTMMEELSDLKSAARRMQKENLGIDDLNMSIYKIRGKADIFNPELLSPYDASIVRYMNANPGRFSLGEPTSAMGKAAKERLLAGQPDTPQGEIRALQGNIPEGGVGVTGATIEINPRRASNIVDLAMQDPTGRTLTAYISREKNLASRIQKKVGEEYQDPDDILVVHAKGPQDVVPKDIGFVSRGEVTAAKNIRMETWDLKKYQENMWKQMSQAMKKNKISTLEAEVEFITDATVTGGQPSIRLKIARRNWEDALVTNSKMKWQDYETTKQMVSDYIKLQREQRGMSTSDIVRELPSENITPAQATDRNYFTELLDIFNRNFRSGSPETLVREVRERLGEVYTIEDAQFLFNNQRLLTTDSIIRKMEEAKRLGRLNDGGMATMDSMVRMFRTDLEVKRIMNAETNVENKVVKFIDSPIIGQQLFREKLQGFRQRAQQPVVPPIEQVKVTLEKKPALPVAPKGQMTIDQAIKGVKKTTQTEQVKQTQQTLAAKPVAPKPEVPVTKTTISVKGKEGDPPIAGYKFYKETGTWGSDVKVTKDLGQKRSITQQQITSDFVKKHSLRKVYRQSYDAAKEIISNIGEGKELNINQYKNIAIQEIKNAQNQVEEVINHYIEINRKIKNKNVINFSQKDINDLKQTLTSDLYGIVREKIVNNFAQSPTEFIGKINKIPKLQEKEISTLLDQLKLSGVERSVEAKRIREISSKENFAGVKFDNKTGKLLWEKKLVEGLSGQRREEPSSYLVSTEEANRTLATIENAIKISPKGLVPSNNSIIEQLGEIKRTDAPCVQKFRELIVEHPNGTPIRGIFQSSLKEANKTWKENLKLEEQKQLDGFTHIGLQVGNEFLDNKPPIANNVGVKFYSEESIRSFWPKTLSPLDIVKQFRTDILTKAKSSDPKSVAFNKTLDDGLISVFGKNYENNGKLGSILMPNSQFRKQLESIVTSTTPEGKIMPEKQSASVLQKETAARLKYSGEKISAEEQAAIFAEQKARSKELATKKEGSEDAIEIREKIIPREFETQEQEAQRMIKSREAVVTEPEIEAKQSDYFELERILRGSILTPGQEISPKLAAIDAKSFVIAIIKAYNTRWGTNLNTFKNNKFSWKSIIDQYSDKPVKKAVEVSQKKSESFLKGYTYLRDKLGKIVAFAKNEE